METVLIPAVLAPCALQRLVATLSLHHARLEDTHTSVQLTHTLLAGLVGASLAIDAATIETRLRGQDQAAGTEQRPQQAEYRQLPAQHGSGFIWHLDSQVRCLRALYKLDCT